MSSVWATCSVAGCGKRIPNNRANYEAHLVHAHGWTKAQAVEQFFRDGQAERLRALTAKRPYMRDWTLESFPADDEAGQHALDAARRWLDGEALRLFVHGPPGTGKTGLAVATARHWIEVESGDSLFENVRALLAEQRSRIARAEAQEAEGDKTGLDRLLGLDHDGCLVVLDDVGAERPTEYALETIALVVEHLHANEVPLIVTTNYAPAALAKRLGHADLVVGQRIVSRLLEDALRIHLDRVDLRVTSEREPEPSLDAFDPRDQGRST